MNELRDFVDFVFIPTITFLLGYFVGRVFVPYIELELWYRKHKNDK